MELLGLRRAQAQVCNDEVCLNLSVSTHVSCVPPLSTHVSSPLPSLYGSCRFIACCAATCPCTSWLQAHMRACEREGEARATESLPDCESVCVCLHVHVRASVCADAPGMLSSRLRFEGMCVCGLKAYARLLGAKFFVGWVLCCTSNLWS